VAITKHCNLKTVRGRAGRSGLYLRGSQHTLLQIQQFRTGILEIDEHKRCGQICTASAQKLIFPN